MQDDRSGVVLGAVVGAALGGLVGYFFLTERGRQLRHNVGLRVDAFAHDLASVQATVATVRAAMDDGLRIISSVVEHRQT